MNLKQLFKKAFILSIAVLSSVLIISSSLLYYYQDTIINKFVQEANSYLKTPVHVGKIDISVIESFPIINITFFDIKVESSLEEPQSIPLLIAKRLDVSLDPIEIIKGNYTIQGLTVIDATCYMKVNTKGETNYQIIKKSNPSESKDLAMELVNIQLENVEYSYLNEINKTEIKLFTNKSEANLVSEGGTYYISTEGNYNIDSISIKNQNYIAQKEIDGVINLEYHQLSKSVEITKSMFNLNGSEFLTFGNYTFNEDSPEVNIYLEGNETDLNTISQLLPNRILRQISKYQSSGDAYFNLALEGFIKKTSGPKLSIQFGLDNTNILYPEKDVTIQEATAEGLFIAKDIFNISSSFLELRNMTGKLDKREFSGEIKIENFSNPTINFVFDGEVALSSLSKFANLSDFERADGLLDIDLQFKGSMNDLKSKATADKISTNGQIEFKNLSLKHKKLKYPLEDLNGAFLFNNSNVALSDVKGNYGRSDFLLNGFFKNLFAYLLFPNEPIGIEATLRSDFIDLNELLATSDNSNSETYTFKLSRQLRLKFNCDVTRLVFRRLDAKNLNGGIIIKNQQIQSDKISFNGLGGKIELRGFANTSKQEVISTNSSLKISDVYIDSIFHVFENFNQNFIIDKNLKGLVSADIETIFETDTLLHLYPKSLESTINMTIQRGELNNFEPLQSLSKYVEEDKLNALRFSEISTDLLIKDETIYLPEIEVKSNITELKISGTHGFDQHINYKVATPLRRQNKVDKDESFGAIEENDVGKTILYLKIEGTTSDYKVSYDKEEVKKKIASDLRKEVQELKRAFKEKGLKKDKKIELEEDDYFDW